MLEALNKEVEVLEGHVPIFHSVLRSVGVRAEQQQQQQQRPRFGEQRPATASALFAGYDGQKKCAFCLRGSCEKYKDTSERKKILMKFARCFAA